MNTTIHHATQKQRTSNWENHKQEQIKHNPIAQTLHPNASNTYIYKFMNIYSYREPDTERERERFYCRDRWREKWRERHHQGQPTTLRNSEMLLTFTNNNSPSSNAANGICFSTKATPHPSFYYLMYPHPPNLSSFLLPNSRLQSNQNPNLVPKQSSLTFIQSNIKDKREKSGS